MTGKTTKSSETLEVRFPKQTSLGETWNHPVSGSFSPMNLAIPWTAQQHLSTANASSSPTFPSNFRVKKHEKPNLSNPTTYSWNNHLHQRHWSTNLQQWHLSVIPQPEGLPGKREAGFQCPNVLEYWRSIHPVRFLKGRWHEMDPMLWWSCWWFVETIVLLALSPVMWRFYLAQKKHGILGTTDGKIGVLGPGGLGFLGVYIPKVIIQSTNLPSADVSPVNEFIEIKLIQKGNTCVHSWWTFRRSTGRHSSYSNWWFVCGWGNSKEGFLFSHQTIPSLHLTSWWFQPIWKIFVKMGIFPK